jgi:hypothetical protein
MTSSINTYFNGPHVYTEMQNRDGALVRDEPALRRLVAHGADGTLTEELFHTLATATDMGSFPGRTYSYTRHDYRFFYCREVSWAVYTVEYMQALAQAIRPGERVVEVGAGRGMLGLHMPRYLPERATWICTDILPPAGAGHVLKFDAFEAVEQFKPDVVFASWAPYQDDMDMRLARMVPCIFIGEGNGGCTGSEGFWSEAERKRYTICDAFLRDDVPRWTGLNDSTFRTFPVTRGTHEHDKGRGRGRFSRIMRPGG